MNNNLRRTNQRKKYGSNNQRKKDPERIIQWGKVHQPKGRDIQEQTEIYPKTKIQRGK